MTHAPLHVYKNNTCISTCVQEQYTSACVQEQYMHQCMCANWCVFTHSFALKLFKSF